MEKLSVVYDIECLPNITTLVFLDVNTKKEIINKFKKLDISNKPTNDFFFNNTNNSTFKYHDTYSKDHLINELYRLKTYVESLSLIIGYNNLKYDDVLLFNIISKIDTYVRWIEENKIKKFLLDIYDTSNNIINAEPFIFTNEKKAWRFYPNKPTSIDLQKLNHLDVSFTSLKQCEVILKWHNVKEFELPSICEYDAYYYDEYVKKTVNGKVEYVKDNLANYPNLWEQRTKEIETFARYIPKEYIDDLFYYNINDVLATLTLLNYSKPEIIQRANITQKYKVNVLSLSRSSTAEKLFVHFYLQASGEDYKEVKNKRDMTGIVALKEIIDPRIKFEDPQLKELVSKIKKNIVGVTPNFKHEIVYAGNKFSFGLGGVHTIDRPGIFKSTDKYKYTDADAESFYPTTFINNDLCPRHLNKDHFIPMYIKLKDTRLYAKHNRYDNKGNLNEELDTENEALKIVLNAVYGKSKESNSFIYDPKVTYGITINCQLYIMKLVEMYTNAGIQVINANTDGVVSKVYNEQQAEYQKIGEKWENMFSQSLEYNVYKEYIRNDVNNYISIKPDGKIKAKGRFLNKIDLSRGYAHPVVKLAVLEYFINGVNFKDFIRNHITKDYENIHDYMVSVKVGRQFYVHEYTMDKKGKLTIKTLPHTNRYYISNSGASLFKQYKDKAKKINLVTGEYVTVMNKIEIRDDYDIKFSYYIKEAGKIIDNVLGKIVKVKHGRSMISGNMFDELEDF